MKKIEYVNIHFEDGSGMVLRQKEHLKAIQIALEKYNLRGLKNEID